MFHCPRFPIVAIVATTVMLAGCVSSSAYPARTDAWERASLARTERRLEQSPQLIRDPDLQAYLAGLMQLLDPGLDRAEPLRIYLLDRPDRQADLLGGQVLRFNLGLLLVLDDEAELAFVLAHELAHRDLQHDEARRSARWDALAAEVQADQAADSVLDRLGYPDATGLTLLRRLHEASTEPAARSQLASRVAAMAESSGVAGVHSDGGRARFERHLAPYRARHAD